MIAEGVVAAGTEVDDVQDELGAVLDGLGGDARREELFQPVEPEERELVTCREVPDVAVHGAVEVSRGGTDEPALEQSEPLAPLRLARRHVVDVDGGGDHRSGAGAGHDVEARPHAERLADGIERALVLDVESDPDRPGAEDARRCATLDDEAHRRLRQATLPLSRSEVPFGVSERRLGGHVGLRQGQHSLVDEQRRAFHRAPEREPVADRVCDGLHPGVVAHAARADGRARTQGERRHVGHVLRQLRLARDAGGRAADGPADEGTTPRTRNMGCLAVIAEPGPHALGEPVLVRRAGLVRARFASEPARHSRRGRRLAEIAVDELLLDAAFDLLFAQLFGRMLRIAVAGLDQAVVELLHQDAGPETAGRCGERARRGEAERRLPRPHDGEHGALVEPESWKPHLIATTSSRSRPPSVHRQLRVATRDAHAPS